MSTEGYVIKYSSIDQFCSMVNRKINGWYEQLDAVEEALNQFVEMDSFRGESAECVKAYIKEVHGTLLMAIRQTLLEYQSRLMLYQSRYYEIESDGDACMPQEVMRDIKERVNIAYANVEEEAGFIESVVGSISDLVNVSDPSPDGLLDALQSVSTRITEYDRDIQSYEDSCYSDARENLSELITTLQRTVDYYYNSRISIKDYQSGDYTVVSEMQELCQRVNVSMGYMQENSVRIEAAAESIKNACEQIRADYEATYKDIWIDKGVTLAGISPITDAMASPNLIASVKTAIPIVNPGGISGSCTVSYGVSNVAKEMQDLAHGAKEETGSVTAGSIRNTLFCGNQGAYGAWGSLSMLTAGLLVSYPGVSEAVFKHLQSVDTKTSVELWLKETKNKIIATTQETLRKAEELGSKMTATLEAVGAGIGEATKDTEPIDVVQTLLDVAGFIPGYGEIADGANALIYAARGDGANAALSAAACIPLIGSLGTGGKVVSKGGKIVDAIDDGMDAARSAEQVGDVLGVVKQAANQVDDQAGKIAGSVIEGGTNALQIGKTDLDALRNKLGVPETDTIAVGKTDVKGLEGVTFEGQSPKVRSEARLPDLDEIWAGRNIKSPGNNPLFTRHAEEVLANDFDRAVIEAGINPQDVSGVLKIHQSNPTGVCRKCIQGLANDNVSSGVLKQLSLKYPNLRIEVTSEILPDVKVTGKSNFVIQNGQYVE